MALAAWGLIAWLLAGIMVIGVLNVAKRAVRRASAQRHASVMLTTSPADPTVANTAAHARR